MQPLLHASQRNGDASASHARLHRRCTTIASTAEIAVEPPAVRVADGSFGGLDGPGFDGLDGDPEAPTQEERANG
jgi:hypothetical protein